MLVTRAVAADAGGASSALNLLVSTGVLLGVGSAAGRALPVLFADRDLPKPAAAHDDDRGLRWGVAGFVSCLPLFGFVAWFLPAMGGEVAGSGSSSDQMKAQNTQRYLACAALYGVANVSRGFDVQDWRTWAIAIACAFHLQLERAAFESETREETRETNYSLAPGKRTKPKTKENTLGAPSATTVLNALVKTAVSKEREAVAEVVGEENDENNDRLSSTTKSWRGGYDLNIGLPKAKALSLSRPKLPEINPPELTVRGVGRAIGATQIRAARLRTEIEEGKLRASIEEEDAVERERLQREGLLIGAEISDWDKRFEFRTMTRDQLLRIARDKGMKGYSKLRRGELLQAVEEELCGDDR